MLARILGVIVGLMVGLLAQSWWAVGVFCLAGLVAGHLYAQLHAPVEQEPMPPSLRELGLEDAPVKDLGPLPPPPTRAEVEASARELFADHVCALFGAVARADGEAVRDEVRVVRAYFEETLRFSERELDHVRLALKKALASPVDLDASARACREELPPADRLLLLDALYELALADGTLRRAERDVIEQIAAALEISETEHRSVRAVHFPDGDVHYARLGLQATATDEEIKSAFRRLAAAHHPDRVAHLGAGAVEAAGRTFREIKDAYDALRQLRGL